MSQKVLVVGIDGATFDIVLPLVEKGKLPNFEKLIKGGIWGELESTIPPFTGPAWVSFQTGRIPSNHRIFDFICKKPNSYETYYVNSTYIKASPFWKILGDNEIKVGIINVPITYPPYPVNGFLLTGGNTPPGKNFAYPPSLAPEIRDRFGEYRLWRPGGITLTEGGEEKFMAAWFSSEERRMEMARYLMNTRDWDFFTVMLESADPLQHELWKYIDKNHPRYSPKAPKYIKEAIPNFYRKIDGFLGEHINDLSDETTICIMSDHGFGPLNRYIIVNNFLLSIRMLEFKENYKTSLKKIASNNRIINLARLYNLGRKLGFNSLISTFMGGWQEKTLSNLVLSSKDIDWARTKAFSIGTGGHIYLNVKGREPQGAIEPGQEYENTRDFIIKELESLTDSQTGEKAIEKVYTKEDLHMGRFSDEAPDISFLPSRGYGTLHQEQFVSPSVFIDSPTCGTHRINGILMFYGHAIRKGAKIEGAKIYDIAPTILHLFNLPVPEDMNGQVLREIFAEDSEPAREEVRYQESGGKERIHQKIKRLKELGKI